MFTRLARFTRTSSVLPRLVRVRGNASASVSAATSLADKNVSFPGATFGSVYTEKMEFLSDFPTIPTYRVLDIEGKVIVEGQDPKIAEDNLIKMYQTMVKLNQMDLILYDAQRQGRISFYMTHHGEE
ncbi:hypothetical protein HDU99_000562, partial [Rhizoclosmatium hyalinum]